MVIFPDCYSYVSALDLSEDHQAEVTKFCEIMRSIKYGERMIYVMKFKNSETDKVMKNFKKLNIRLC